MTVDSAAAAIVVTTRGRASVGLAFRAVSLRSCFGREESGAAGTDFPSCELLQSFSRA
jgi:hypothetical protein